MNSATHCGSRRQNASWYRRRVSSAPGISQRWSSRRGKTYLQALSKQRQRRLAVPRIPSSHFCFSRQSCPCSDSVKAGQNCDPLSRLVRRSLRSIWVWMNRNRHLTLAKCPGAYAIHSLVECYGTAGARLHSLDRHGTSLANVTYRYYCVAVSLRPL